MLLAIDEEESSSDEDSEHESDDGLDTERAIAHNVNLPTHSRANLNENMGSSSRPITASESEQRIRLGGSQCFRFFIFRF